MGIFHPALDRKHVIYVDPVTLKHIEEKPGSNNTRKPGR